MRRAVVTKPLGSPKGVVCTWSLMVSTGNRMASASTPPTVPPMAFWMIFDEEEGFFTGGTAAAKTEALDEPASTGSRPLRGAAPPEEGMGDGGPPALRSENEATGKTGHR